MATTEYAIVDAIRATVAAAGYAEAVGFDFGKAPSLSVERAFVVRYEADTPIGGWNYSEEARGRVTVALARAVNGDYQTARRAAWTDQRDLVNAIVRAGTTDGYAVEDAGRTALVEAPKGANYLVLTLTLPVNFEAAL